MSESLNIVYDETPNRAVMRVIGVGGGGCNAVDRMIASKMTGVDFVSVNTDVQVLSLNQAPRKIAIGKNLTQGLGAGADPAIGKQAAEEDKRTIAKYLDGANIVFITSGMGGGTGTGAAPVIAEIAKSTGALTIAVVTLPFDFENPIRMEIAMSGIAALRSQVDTLVIIPNDRLQEALKEKDPTVTEAFLYCDEILMQAVRGISDLIATPGIINLDYADVRKIMLGSGEAVIGLGTSITDVEGKTLSGPEAGKAAAEAALNHPMLGSVAIDGAKGALINVSGSPELKLSAVRSAASHIKEKIGNKANIILGTSVNKEIPKDEVRVTVIVTGFKSSNGNDQDQVPFELDEEIKETMENSRINTQDLEVPTVIRREPERYSYEKNAETNGNGSSRHSVRRIISEVDLDKDPPTDQNMPNFLSRRN